MNEVISLEDCPEGFATEVTQATNTQNQVEARDYASLDARQGRLRDDFILSLPKTYTFKRGDIEPAPEAGCSIVEATQALACAHRNPELAMRAKQNQELLWESGPQGSYELLFGPQPSALRVWRTVLVMRTVLAHLRAGERNREGRTAQIADQGDLLSPELPSAYRPASRDSERKTKAVSVIVDSGKIAYGAPVEFRPATGPERKALLAWIASDPRRGRATWVNDRSRPLLWTVDGKQYSPSGLLMYLLKLAPGEPPKAVQGTTRWFFPGLGSLADLADEIRNLDAG
jgi:hypothetical protein